MSSFPRYCSILGNFVIGFTTLTELAACSYSTGHHRLLYLVPYIRYTPTSYIQCLTFFLHRSFRNLQPIFTYIHLTYHAPMHLIYS
ncbi:hypothetical protein F5Y14DRAFT_413472 [Nemania sp. NC0429]|nr:hypothetical protein F5Y14DRAFT_413472 [Nemania sp. NC0429]